MESLAWSQLPGVVVVVEPKYNGMEEKWSRLADQHVSNIGA